MCYSKCQATMLLPMHILLGFIGIFTLGAVHALDGTVPAFPALIAFGDSIIDTGNNNLLPTIAKSNFPPYGKDFINHLPTGRFSNGRVPVDLIASNLGIKDLLPPYLSPEIRDEDLPSGVCFASGGSGFDPLTSKTASVISMDAQLNLYKDYQMKLRAFVGEERAAAIIRDSLYFICTGSNDIVTTYFGARLRELHYDFPTYVKFLISSACSFVEELYNLGARKVVVFGVPPLGCIPSQRTLAGGIKRDCVNLYNQASQKYNQELSMGLQMLSNKLNDSKIIYSDIYEKVLHLMQHHSDYGFSETTKGCCGTGELEAAIFCNHISSTTCLDDSKYLFWDSFHPTEKAYKIIVEEFLNESIQLF